MLAIMAFVRNMLTCLLVLGLTFGTGWASCAPLQQQRHADASSPDGHLPPHQGHEHSITHDHEPPGDAHLVSSADPGQPESADHACLKCCGACMLTSVIPLAALWTVVTVASRISFAALSEQLRGRIVFVDPDIPKQTV